MRKLSLESLSKREILALEYIDRESEKNGYAPTTREVGAHIGALSSSTAHYAIHSLISKGFLVMANDRSPRSIALTDEARDCLHEEQREEIRESIRVLRKEAIRVTDAELMKSLMTAVKCMEKVLQG